MKIVIALLLVAGTASAQQTPVCTTKAGAVAKCPKTAPPPRTINIDPLALGGKQRGLGMLYFIERANEELERASLERKSFIPKLARSVDEAAL